MANALKWLDRDEGPVNYGEPTYWERRYELDRRDFGRGYRHDWYISFDKLKATFESYFGQPKGQRILIVGCGHSAIPAEMHAMGYRCVTALDISATVVALMQAEHQTKEGIEYVVGDARRMHSTPDELFDCIFDKGCVDSLMCGYRSTDDVAGMFRECYRVLRPGGVFLCISHGEPDTRLHTLQHEAILWNVSPIPIHGSEGLFAYVCTKWSRDEIDAAESRRLDELDAIVNMRTRSSHSGSTRGRPGIMHENLIVHARAPHEMDAVRDNPAEKNNALLAAEGISVRPSETRAMSAVVPRDGDDVQICEDILTSLSRTLESDSTTGTSALTAEDMPEMHVHASG